jgi:hypothetical protein
VSAIRSIQIALHAFLGVSAVGAGLAFVLVPSGAALGMSVSSLANSPFRDYLIPGLFLAAVIGGANLLSAVVLWRRHTLAPRMSLATGLLLVVWVAIQTAIIGFQDWSQGIWWVTFTLVALLGGLLTRREAPRPAQRRSEE